MIFFCSLKIVIYMRWHYESIFKAAPKQPQDIESQCDVWYWVLSFVGFNLENWKKKMISVTTFNHKILIYWGFDIFFN